MSKARGTMTHLLHEDLARAHESELGVRRRWRGGTSPRGAAARDAERAQSARLALARMVYGGSQLR